MSVAVVELSGVAFDFDTVPVLEGIDLSIAAGEFVGIVGPNGGGKSTLLKLMLGLLRPTAGSVRVLGRNPQRASRRVGYVPQHPRFTRDFPISVEEAVLMGRLGSGRWFGRYRAADRAAALRAMRETEIDRLAGRQIGSLSGGQLQRVLLARALVGEPELLLLDEPTANIDQRMEADIFDLLKQLNERMTIVVVSHDIAFISGYVTRVACVNRSLLCHETASIDGALINDLYGAEMQMVEHHHH